MEKLKFLIFEEETLQALQRARNYFNWPLNRFHNADIFFKVTHQLHFPSIKAPATILENIQLQKFKITTAYVRFNYYSNLIEDTKETCCSYRIVQPQ